MHAQTAVPSSPAGWLKVYYFARFAVSTAWVALAITAGKSSPALAAALLIAYPLWDALANYADARRNGGIGSNRTQLLNFVVSLITAAAVAIAIGNSMNAVLAAFGIWAVLAGLLQLATGLRRRSAAGAQWAMVLSGAQSALAGLFFVKTAGSAASVGITDIAPYAAFGAFYFFISAVWLAIGDARKKGTRAA